MSNLAFIVDCYKNLLGRAPDQEGVDSLIASGASDEAIRQSFLTSSERRTLEEAIDATRGRIRDNGARRNYLLASAFGNGNLGDFAFPAIVAPALERVSGGAIFAHSVSDVAAFPFASERVIPTSFQPMNPIVLRLFDGLIIGPGGLLAWPHWPIWDPGWAELIPIPYAIYACGVEAPLPVDLHKLVQGARWASGRDEASVVALRGANSESTLCPDPILSLYEPGHARVDKMIGRAFIVRGPVRPEHNQLAAELLPNDAVIGLEPDVDAPLCALFPALRFVDSLDALSEVLASCGLIVSERYHGAVVGLLLGKEVHGWVRADHNASKIRELYGSLDIPQFCSERLLLGTTAEFPSDQVSTRLAAIRDSYVPVSRRMIEALEKARPEQIKAERVEPYHAVYVLAPAEDGAHHTGWHGPERDADIVFRWTCDPEVPFGLHRFAAGTTTVTIPLYMAVNDAFLSACRLRVGRMESRATVDAQVLTFSVSFPEATVAPLILVTPSPIVPFQRDGTPDMRPLGVAVRCMA